MKCIYIYILHIYSNIYSECFLFKITDFFSSKVFILLFILSISLQRISNFPFIQR